MLRHLDIKCLEFEVLRNQMPGIVARGLEMSTIEGNGQYHEII